jgi:phosphohistidine phosphatase
MAVYLVQHGKCLSKEVDPDRGLTDEGIAEVKKIAQVAADYGIAVSEISHSGKKRALQTAEIFSTSLGSINIGRIEGINPTDDVIPFAQLLDNEADTMYVGHMPFLARLLSYLITGDTESPVFAFQNGGIVCLDKNGKNDPWVIKWTLMPKID